MAINGDGYLDERVETLYVAPEYNLFLLTGQAEGKGRRAFIAAKPFGALTSEKQAAFAAAARPLTPDARITITASNDTLRIRDGFTGTITNFAIAALDTEVRARLSSADDARWDKFAAPAEAKPTPKRVFKL